MFGKPNFSPKFSASSLDFRMLFLCAGVVSALGSACSTTRSRPCAKGGDIRWYPPLTGNMECYQKIGAKGERVNHGNFRQWYPTGKIALEGAFEEGKKNGLWVLYDENGERIAEKWFEHGIERSIPASERKP